MLGIVVSRADSASVHVGEHLRSLADWTEHEDDSRPDAAGGGTVYRLPDAELREFEDLHIYLDGVGDTFAGVDCIAFASRHAGDTGNLLTAHHTGNFGAGEYGGEAGHFARAAPNAHKRVVEAFDRHVPEGYEVGMECTHHGPTDLTTPSLFVELGSDESAWDDPAGAEAVARAILDLRGVDPTSDRTLVGFGGGHYVPRFERIVRETDWCVGHVGADWSLESMDGPDPAVFRRVFEASGASRAVVEGDRPGLESRIEDLGYRVVSETWAKETTGVPLELVDHLEREVASVEEGLRFGANVHDVATPADLRVETLPGELLDEANGIDGDRALERVREHVVAAVTDEAGTRLAGPVVLGAGPREAVVDELVAVLAGKYDAVERREGVLVARETAFDPELAHERGVPEGPAFGKLAGGQAVEVDGETVDPSSVRREREVRFSLS
ncbi:D-aminoacyl-tRNA deacylase [Halomarina litorea]|uniref:D-aminoacyl-tRNA deacylase n=1 Tax=Halomarina litorea TaxID=2961595 RepID=UPI0020C4433A|nr:D-aminoacyl-tRNA deacylase [Halomarina sp. BCD28]